MDLSEDSEEYYSPKGMELEDQQLEHDQQHPNSRLQVNGDRIISAQPMVNGADFVSLDPKDMDEAVDDSSAVHNSNNNNSNNPRKNNSDVQFPHNNKTTNAPSPQEQIENNDQPLQLEFSYKLTNFSQINEKKIYSPWNSLGGFIWRLLIFPQGNQTPGELALYLDCGGPENEHDVKSDDPLSITTGTSSSSFWSRAASFKLILVNQVAAAAKIELAKTLNNGATANDLIPNTGQQREPHAGSLSPSFNPADSPDNMESQDIIKDSQHRFNEKECDWGFSQFVKLNNITNPEEGFMVNDSLIFKVKLCLIDQSAFDSSYMNYDSRKETGFVGLKNQGATCYMNSLLQTLYHISGFRKAVYAMSIPENVHSNNLDKQMEHATPELSYALQKVFYELQYSPHLVKTKRLTESFGWDSTDAFTQHDVQELNRILCDNLEEKMKKDMQAGKYPENMISTLFEGKIRNFIECIHVNYTSSREESFYDISLNVKGCAGIIESFEKYTEVEMLDGENKYSADGFSELQVAKKGVIFTKLPPVLQLHLKRFEYDFMRDVMVKINDRFEFSKEIDLSKFVENSDGTDVYVLHAVLVHVGDVHGGHYYAFIRTDLSNNNWFKFDDEIVTKVKDEQALDDNFGVGGEKKNGIDDRGMNTGYQPRMRPINARKFSNAYMLQYIRKNKISEIAAPVQDTDIPLELKMQITQEKDHEERRRRERAEQHLYATVAVMTNEDMRAHKDAELVDWDKVPKVRVKRTFTLLELKLYLIEHNIVKCQSPSSVRLWRCILRQNQTMRPECLLANGIDSSPFDPENDGKRYAKSYQNDNMYRIYAETASQTLQVWKPTSILLFFKMYDPSVPELNYVGSQIYDRNEKISNLIPTLTDSFHLTEDLLLYEEVSPSNIAELDTTKAFKDVDMEKGGDIIVFQKNPKYIQQRQGSHYDPKLPLGGIHMPRADNYYKYLLGRIELEFVDRNGNGEALTLECLRQDSYEEVRQRLAYCLGPTYDHNKIRLYRYDVFRGGPKPSPITMNEWKQDKTLDDVLSSTNYASTIMYDSKRAFWFEITDYTIQDFELNDEVRITWRMDGGAKLDKNGSPRYSNVVPFSVLVPYGSTYSRVIEIIAQKIAHEYKGPIRLLEIKNSSVVRELNMNDPVHNITGLSEGIEIRAEPCPADELAESMGDRFSLVALMHVETENKRSKRGPSNLECFGNPCILKVALDGESVGALRQRIQEKFDVDGSIFRSWRLLEVSASRVGILEDLEEIWKPIRKGANGQNECASLAVEHKNYSVKKTHSAAKPLTIRG